MTLTTNDIAENIQTLNTLGLPVTAEAISAIQELRFQLATEFDVPSRDLISAVASRYGKGYEEFRRAL